MNQVLAKKIGMTQRFAEDGTQIGVTMLAYMPSVVSQLKTVEKDGYQAVQVGYGVRKANRATKPVAGHALKAGLQVTPRSFAEERVASLDGYVLGQEVASTLEVGTLVSVTGTSKGKGFQGGVRRHHFSGGDKTHGASDRHRAPGSIGSGTSPAKVWKGQRMAGHMGHTTITTRNLKIYAIEDGLVYVTGAVPGPKGSIVTIRRAV